jgi:hypothetical protein
MGEPNRTGTRKFYVVKNPNRTEPTEVQNPNRTEPNPQGMGSCVALASIFTEITQHRQRNLNRGFDEMFLELQALDYPIQID